MGEAREKLAFVSHCIMNQAARAWWGEESASREKGMVFEVVRLLREHDIGIIQLECPEFSLYGNPRQLRSKEEYDTPEFRRKCRGIAQDACDMMEAFLGKEVECKIDIVVFLGFEGSPSCGVEYTTRTVDDEHRRTPGRGHLIDALIVEMKRRELETPFLGISLREEEKRDALKRLEAIITKSKPQGQIL